MRVLHVVSNVGIQSGVMKFIMTYYRKLDDEIQFDFLCWDDSYQLSYKEEIRALGGNIYFVKKPTLFSNDSWSTFFHKYEKNYDIIHLHMCFLNNFIRKRLKNNTKLICHAHTDKFSDKKINALRNKILCLPIVKNSDMMLACSKEAGINYFGQLFTEKGSVVLNALDFTNYKANDIEKEHILKSIGINKEETIYIHIGGFRKQKNHKFLIEIFNEIYKIDRNSKLLLVGDGPLRLEIEKMVIEQKLNDNVVFLGVRSDVPKLLSISDYCIFPSIFEGLGIVLIESQVSGVNTYCSDVIPKEAFVSDKIHSLSLTRSAKEWSRTILNGSPKVEELSTIKMESYDINKAVKKLEDIYKTMLEI